MLFPIIIISGLGIAVLSSISLKLGLNQFLFFSLGLIAWLGFSRIPYQLHQYLIKVYGAGSLILLCLPFLFGSLTRGAIRWIQLGPITLQPSEIIKPFLIIIFSYWLSAKGRFGPYLLLLLLPAVLIFKQPDLGSTLVVTALWLGILFASKLARSGLIRVMVLAVVLAPLLWFNLQPYQQLRLTSFISPFADPRTSGYHLIQSIISVGSGQFWGRGLGRGTQSQLKFLPERHTDFIFASLAEETGFWGSGLLLIAYFTLFKRLLFVSRQAPDEFSRLIIIGVFSLIFFQFSVNIAMNLGLLPITGITLPLVSSGGSSILAVMISLGLVQNISRYSLPRKRLEIK